MVFAVASPSGAPPGLNLDPRLSPVQRSTNIANQGVGATGSQFRDPKVFRYFQELLADRLLDPSGNVVTDNIRDAVKPIELQFISQMLGRTPETTSDLFSAFGFGDIASTPVTGDQISKAIRNTLVSRNEGGLGGDKSGTQGVGRSMGLSLPNRDELGATALGLGVLSPALGPPAALGALGVGAFGDIADALGIKTGIVGGPNRPQVGTDEFGALTGRLPGPGRVGEGIGGLGAGVGATGDRTAVGGPTAGFGGANRRSAPTGDGAIGGGGGGDRDREGDRSGSGSPSRGPHYMGGLIKEGYAEGGEIGMAIGDALGDPSFIPPPQGVGPDDVSITAQNGEFVMAKPAVEALGADFLNVLNDVFMKNPGLDPKMALKAASTMLPKIEAATPTPPGDLGANIGAAIPSPGGPFAQGGLIGARPIRV